MGPPTTVICTFRVRNDSMTTFQELLDRHWPALRSLELVTDTPEQLFSRDGEHDSPMIVSIFEWVSEEAAEQAHDHPEIAEIWEAMEPQCESRDGRPSMEFPHFRPLEVDR